MVSVRQCSINHSREQCPVPLAHEDIDTMASSFFACGSHTHDKRTSAACGMRGLGGSGWAVAGAGAAAVVVCAVSVLSVGERSPQENASSIQHCALRTLPAYTRMTRVAPSIHARARS